MGDDACWLNRVCLECGRFLDEDLTGEESCPHCGADLSPAVASGRTGETRGTSRADQRR